MRRSRPTLAGIPTCTGIANSKRGNRMLARLKTNPESEASRVDAFQGKPRVFVLSDIGNEPDDQMSLTRFLLYSNEYDIEGLVAVTSTWQRHKVSPEIMERVISNYG